MRLRGTAERPRLTVFRSLRHISAQVVDDEHNRVLAAISSDSSAMRGELVGLNKTDKAKKIGNSIAEQCKARGVEDVVLGRFSKSPRLFGGGVVGVVGPGAFGQRHVHIVQERPADILQIHYRQIVIHH